MLNVTALSGFGSGDRAFRFRQTLTGNVANYNLKSAAIAAGWNQIDPLDAEITVASGSVYATTTGVYAFNTGAGFPDSTRLKLVVNAGARIVGCGGAGGAGGGASATTSIRVGKPGGAGGPALIAQHPISVQNHGTIGGGGGGGGGSRGGSYENSNDDTVYFSGATGGVGAGLGAAGPAVIRYRPGAPGIKASISGAGGSLGAAGARGTTGLGGYDAEGGAGGAAGRSVVGNTHITWLATGTRLGPIIA